MCKHLIAISATLRLEVCVIPKLAKTVPLGQKRKRGAPSRAKKALIFDFRLSIFQKKFFEGTNFKCWGYNFSFLGV